jgi:FkbM family methyltransferase
MKLVHKLKQLRDRFIDNVVMKSGAFRKAQYRLREKEGVFAHVAKDKNGLKFLYAPADFTIGAALIERGSWQYDELTHYLKYVAGKAQGRKACFFDIGANIGTQTVYAARSGHFSRVFAIEAMPSNFELLVANVVLNECTTNTTCFNKALGAEDARRTFIFNPLNPGGSRQEDGSIHSEEVVLDVVKTADFVRGLLENEGQPDLLVFWIDVEGLEEEVVMELRELADEFETYFCVEYNESSYKADAESSMRSYVESRDEMYVLGEGGMEAISDLSQVRDNQDIVFSGKASNSGPQ